MKFQGYCRVNYRVGAIHQSQSPIIWNIHCPTRSMATEISMTGSTISMRYMALQHSQAVLLSCVPDFKLEQPKDVSAADGWVRF